MNCNQCVEVNPIPACLLEDSDEYILSGITFPNNVDDTITVRFENKATGRVNYMQVDVDISGIPELDIAPFMPLMDHPYSLTFYNLDGSPTNFIITNPDTTTATGCCIEFKTHQGLTGEQEWVLTTTGCNVDA